MEDEDIERYMTWFNFNGTDLEFDFLKQIIRNFEKTKKKIILDENLIDVLNSDEYNKKEIIFHFHNNTKTSLQEIYKESQSIMSEGWYLDKQFPSKVNNNSYYYSDDLWKDFYLNDPSLYYGPNIEVTDESKYILGGVAMIDGLFYDDTNIVNSLFPKLAAVADTLWTPHNTTNIDFMEYRLSVFRCNQLVRNNIPSSPLKSDRFDGKFFCPFLYQKTPKFVVLMVFYNLKRRKRIMCLYH
jgi:hypothetical protein